MRVVITGASGNVGTAVVRRLREDGAELVGVSRRRPGSAYDDVEWHEIDLSDGDAEKRLRPVVDGADAVVHLAWAIQPGHDRDLLLRTNRGGTRAVAKATVAAGVPQLVHASSVGTYAATWKRDPQDESHPATGLPSHYSKDKAWCEALLDDLEAAQTPTRVARVRSAIVMHEDAASEVVRFFLGPLLGGGRRFLGELPVVPLPFAMRLQVVHADDLADVYARVITGRASGAFNVAADPILTSGDLARALGGRQVPVPTPLVMAAASLTWRLRLQPVDAGWVAMASAVPMMSTARAKAVLGWQPVRSASDALEGMVTAMREGVGVLSSPPLRPAS